MYVQTSRKSPLTESELRRKVRQRCKVDLFYLCRGVLGMSKLSPHLHQPFANFMQMFPFNGGPENSNRKLGWMPREHFKSSIVSRGLPIQLLINDPNTTIAIFSSKFDNCKKWLRWIRTTIESRPAFRWAFPEIKPGEKWDETEIAIERDFEKTEDVQASITVYSIKGGVASQHHQHLILDDPLNEQSAFSEIERERAIELYVHLESVLKGWYESTFTVTGTPWPGYDVITHSMEHEVATGYRLFWGIGAKGGFEMSPELKDHPYAQKWNLVPDVDDRLIKDKVIFAEECPIEKLDKLQGQDLNQYYYQYCCIRPEDEDNGFRIEKIHNFSQLLEGELECDCHPDHKHDLRRMVVIGVCDPALSEARSACESAIVVLGVDRDCGCRFILDEWGGRVKTPELVDKLCEIGKKWEAYMVRFGIEDVQFQVTLKWWMQERQARGEFPLSIDVTGVSPNQRDKDLRIMRQQPYVRDNLWHKRPNMTLDEHVVNILWQIWKWPRQPKKRDRIDAWAYCDDVWEELYAPKMQGASAGQPDTLVAMNRAIEARDVARMDAAFKERYGYSAHPAQKSERVGRPWDTI